MDGDHGIGYIFIPRKLRLFDASYSGYHCEYFAYQLDFQPTQPHRPCLRCTSALPLGFTRSHWFKLHFEFRFFALLFDVIARKRHSLYRSYVTQLIRRLGLTPSFRPDLFPSCSTRSAISFYHEVHYIMDRVGNVRGVKKCKKCRNRKMKV